jgi:hypothetical protein
MILTGENRGNRRKACLSATLSIWTALGTNPGLRGELYGLVLQQDLCKYSPVLFYLAPCSCTVAEHVTCTVQATAHTCADVGYLE